MYKNCFRIGFGGCGCAFVDTFEEHVYRLFRSYLLEKYKELAKWSKIFSEDERLEMEANLDRLKKLIFEEKLDLDNLGNIEKHLGEWSEILEKVKGGMKRSYEKIPVEKIENIIEKLKTRLRRIKKEYGVWLEALTVDSYSSGEKEDTGRYLYNKFLDDTRQIRISEFGMDILDADGFNHHPELQMLPFTLQEVRNEVYTDLNSEIKKVNKKASRGHFFFLGLGGGTGTGVISPLAQEFSKGTRGYFTLGALGGEDDNDYLNSQQPWFRRCFNMLLALNDLIVTAKLDGLLLVDNKILMKNLKEKLKKREIIEITNNSNEESLKEVLKKFHKNGWIVAYYLKDEPIAKIVSYKYYQEDGEDVILKLDTALGQMCDGVGLPLISTSYYDFRYPNANRIMIIVDGQWVEGTNTFDLMIPSDVRVYDRSYCHWFWDTGGSTFKLDGTEISNFKYCDDCWVVRYGKLTPTQLMPGEFHTISLWYDAYSQPSFACVAIALAYKEE